MPAVLAALLLAAACDAREGGYPAGGLQVTGGSGEQRALLIEIVDGVRPRGIDAVRIEPADAGWRPFPPGGVQLAVTLTEGERERGGWEAAMLANVFAHRSDLEELPVVVAYGTPATASRLEGPDAPDPAIFPRPAEPGAGWMLTDAVRRAAAASGAELVTLDVVQPYDALAAAVVLSVEEPAAYLDDEAADVLEALGRYRAQLEGAFVEIRDREGRPVLTDWWTGSRSIAVMSSWIRPGLEGCSPVYLRQPCCDPQPFPPCPRE